MNQQINNLPSWLPRPFNLTGDWDRDLPGLYAVFHNDFKLTRRNFKGGEIWYDQNPVDVGEFTYEGVFWHLISEESNDEERYFDSNRSEKLPWCGPSISNPDAAEIKCWDYEEKDRRVNTYIWLKELDYVVILRRREMRRGAVYFLITAFHVESEGRRRSFESKYKRRVPNASAANPNG